MSWTLAAAGTAQDADAEKELQDKLTVLLSTGKYGCGESQLASGQHNGPVHLKPSGEETSGEVMPDTE